MMQEHDEEYMTAAQAVTYITESGLKMTKVKMSALLKGGVLPWDFDPLDARTKLIPVSAVRTYVREQQGKMRRRVVDPKALALAS